MFCINRVFCLFSTAKLMIFTQRVELWFPGKTGRLMQQTDDSVGGWTPPGAGPGGGQAVLRN